MMTHSAALEYQSRFRSSAGQQAYRTSIAPKNYLHLAYFEVFQFIHPVNKLVFRVKIFAEMTCLLASTVVLVVLQLPW